MLLYRGIYIPASGRDGFGGATVESIFNEQFGGTFWGFAGLERLLFALFLREGEHRIAKFNNMKIGSKMYIRFCILDQITGISGHGNL